MVSSLPILLSCLVLVPTVLSASFPLTAISHYSSLAPCAVSHLDQELNNWPYDGCSSATPISAYGSCICAQRLHSIQFEISLDFGADTECSTTAVQPFLTAFCDKWGVDIAAADNIQASTTTTLAGSGPTSGGMTLVNTRYHRDILTWNPHQLHLAMQEMQGCRHRLQALTGILRMVAYLITRSASSLVLSVLRLQ